MGITETTPIESWMLENDDSIVDEIAVNDCYEWMLIEEVHLNHIAIMEIKESFDHMVMCLLIKKLQG